MTNITRNYKSLEVQDATKEELLFELLFRSALMPSADKIEFLTLHHEIIIGIGKNDVAYLYIDIDSFQILRDRIAESNPGCK